MEIALAQIAQSEIPPIVVSGLCRSFKTPVRESGVKAAFVSLFHRRYREVKAVRDLSFSIERGTLVGFIGPNGAGKTTTMKMLSGILHPTSGSVEVLGYQPHRRSHDLLKRIALLRGSQPISGPAELTVADHFNYRCLLYDVPRREISSRVAELEEIVGLRQLMPRQVRGLSLGERMRAGLALALVHRPEVIFLDEPTIGLDATAAVTFRRFVESYAKTTGATVMLTSHYLAEVEALCSRILLIDEGRLRYDGTLSGLAASLAPWKEIRLVLPEPATNAQLSLYGDIIESPEPQRIALRVPRNDTAEVTQRIITDLRPLDLSVMDPPLEVVMDAYYQQLKAGV